MGRLEHLKQTHSGRTGFVTRDLPLLSNLSTLQNIALIKQYHENLPADRAYVVASERLSLLRLAPIAPKRISLLTEEEIFWVKLLRATMLQDAEIIIDRPLQQTGPAFNLNLLYEHLMTLTGFYARCSIFDLNDHMERYRSFNG